MLLFLLSFFIFDQGFASPQEALEEELFGKKINILEVACKPGKCLVCDDEQSNNIQIEPCGHFSQCKDCLTKYVKSSLESGYLPLCIDEQCRNKISLSIISQLFHDDPCRDDLVYKYKQLATVSNPNFRCCPNDKKTLIKSTCNDWHQYCEACEKPHCFQCGVSHAKNLSCLEACPEQFSSLIAVYREMRKFDPELEWKICPQCGTPAEKKDGCDEVKCGLNYHSCHAKLNARVFGCGRRFNWNHARRFNPDEDLELENSFESEEKRRDQLSFQEERYLQQNPGTTWLSCSQMADIYTLEMAFLSGATELSIDFEPIMDLFNQRFSAWFEEKSVYGERNGSFYLSLVATLDGATKSMFHLIRSVSGVSKQIKHDALQSARKSKLKSARDISVAYAVNKVVNLLFILNSSASLQYAVNGVESLFFSRDQLEHLNVILENELQLLLRQVSGDLSGIMLHQIVERLIFIYVYENLNEILEKAYDSQKNKMYCWKPTNTRLISIIEKIRKNFESENLYLSPFTRVLLTEISYVNKSRECSPYNILKRISGDF